nr:hypothetical protein [Tanacetum cinerariifolium]
MNHPLSPVHPFCCENAVRIILDLVGILQAMKLHKTAKIREGGHDCEISTQEYVMKIIKDVSDDDHFTRDVWLSAVQYLDIERGIAIGCFSDMKTFCANEKLKKVIAVIKSCTPNAL